MKNRNLAVVLGLATVAVAVVSGLSAGRRLSLPDLATAAQIVSLPTLPAASGPPTYFPTISNIPYSWLGSGRVIVTAADGSRIIVGTDTAHRGSTQFLLPPLPDGRCGNFTASPRGDYVLADTLLGNRNTLTAISTTGKHYAVVSPPRLSWDAWWRSDGDGWYDTCRWGAGAAVWYTPINGKRPTQPVGFLSASDSQRHVLGMLADGRVVLASDQGCGVYWSSVYSSFQLPAIPLTALDVRGKRSPTVYSVIPPRDSAPFEMSLSPDGRRLAFLLLAEQPGDYDWLLQHVPYLRRPSTHYSAEIAGVDLSGMHWKVIAATAVSVAPPGPTALLPVDLQWRPDGKAVSVLLRGKLYVVPVR